ncbi:sulfoquinovosyl transferase SQD2 [Skeletonema marinoi]|uniref:Sulfoquinovosyl transferase SQD2 n=1 Tax=Skeletonema marinoi TaxID=267567 RepID=A0AAD8YJY3_9STRA|nr:sulfoquinovosyl transferase SQD2 [Skeletonema marinoi]
MNYLVTNGNDTVELITAEIDSASKPSSWQGVGIHYTFGFGLPSYNQISISFDFTGKALRELYRFSPDVIHATTPGPLLFPSVIASRLFNVPIVMSCHTHLTAYAAAYLPPIINKIAEWFLWRFTEVVHSFADLTLVTSPQIQEEFQHPFGKRGSTLHNFTHTITMLICVSNDWCHPEEFLITYIGRLAEEKRLTLLKDVIQNINGAILCFVGTGPRREPGVCVGRCVRNAKHIRNAGFCCAGKYGKQGACCSRQRRWTEASDSKRNNGFLVPPDKAEEFTRRVQELKANTTLRDHIADAARRDRNSGLGRVQ